MTDSDEVKLLPWPFFGYAPGTYMSQCYRCDRRFENADKRAITCLECAVVQAKMHIADLEARPPVVTDEVVERVATLRGALETCAKTFRRYSELHRAKGTTEGNLKASNNDDLAEFCESVLADDGAIASMPAVVSGGQP